MISAAFLDSYQIILVVALASKINKLLGFYYLNVSIYTLQRKSEDPKGSKSDTTLP